MKLELDFSKLSPTTRDSVIFSLKNLLRKHSRDILCDLDGWDNKNCDAYKEMFQWAEEADSMARQITAFSEDNKL